MTVEMPYPVVAIVRRPIHSPLMHFSAAALIGCLFTDIAYWRTAEIMWADFSSWLVSVGVLLGVLVVIAGLVDLFTGRLRVIGTRGRLAIVGYLIALMVSVFNALIHTHDAWTSVVPWGLALSAITTVILVVAGLMSWGEGYRVSREVIA
jgi:uncharacterized membrane protein